MTTHCQAFRRLLEAALSNGAANTGTGDLTHLGWHAHLLQCDACRALLEGEEALDLVLASLPQPELPAELTARVLARLRRDPGRPAGVGSDALERLLDLDVPAPEVPADLAQRIVAEARLDRWLDVAGEVAVPTDLAQRVLAGVRASNAGSRLRLLRGGSPWSRRVAAAVLVLGAAGLIWRLAPGAPSPASTAVGGAVAQTPEAGAATEFLVVGAGADDELLACLDLLEQLELAERLDPVALDALVYLDVSDEIVRDWDELADTDRTNPRGEAR